MPSVVMLNVEKNIFMLSVIMLVVIFLSVVAPIRQLLHKKLQLTDNLKVIMKYFPLKTCNYWKRYLMEQRTLKNVNNHLNINIYSYIETSGGQSSNLYLNAVHFFNTSVN
jgi:hypothetical protein